MKNGTSGDSIPETGQVHERRRDRRSADLLAAKKADSGLKKRPGLIRKYEPLVDSLAEPALLVQIDGLVVSANPRALNLLEDSQEELVGRDLVQLLRGAPEVRLTRFLKRASQGGARLRVDLTVGSTVKPVQLSAGPVGSDRSGLVCVLMRDRSGIQALCEHWREVGGLLQLVTERMPIILWRLDESGRIIEARSRTRSKEGRWVRGHVGRPFIELAEDPAQLESEVRQALQGEPADTIVTSRTGRAYLVSLMPIKGGRRMRVVGLTLDVSRRMAVERSLREQEEQYRQIINAADEGIWIVSREGRTLFANRRMAEMVGYLPDELIGMPDELIIDPDWSAICRRPRWPVVSPHQPQDCALRTREGNLKWVSLSSAELTRQSGWGPATLRMVTDVSEVRTLEREVLEAAESERRRIAAELHDSVGQTLTGLAFLAEGLKEEISNRAPELREQIETLADLCHEALDTTRSLSHGLSPFGIGERAELGETLKNLAVRTEGLFGIPCGYSCEEDDRIRLNMATVEHICRIAQEAMTNAVRHADARKIDLSLRSSRNSLRLEITDDGVGIEGVECGARAGIGLRNMRYRAGLLGAFLDVSAGPEGGTRVVCGLNLNPAHLAAGSPRS